MEKRKWLAIFYIIFLGIQSVHLLEAVRSPKIESAYDVEFKYSWDWKVHGLTGGYAGVSEVYNSIGHYRIKFNGSIGIVKATVDWTYKYYDSFGKDEDDEGPDLYESNFERYDFTYSLETFEYLSGHDQDEFDANSECKSGFHTYLDEKLNPEIHFGFGCQRIFAIFWHRYLLGRACFI